MFHRNHVSTDAGQGQRLWPVFALLIIVMALPTAGILWFMNEAMQNERDAVRQRLTEVYRPQLKTAAAIIQASWREKSTLLLETGKQKAPEAFASLVAAKNVDSVLFYRDGAIVYPAYTVPRVAEPETPAWKEARNLEFVKESSAAAAAAYLEISKSSGIAESAMALMAQARCLNKSGQPGEAIDILVKKLGGASYRNAADPLGRSISTNALMFALQLMKNDSHPFFAQNAATLFESLNDYRDRPMPSSQRRFLMGQLRSLWPACPPFPTLEAEELAAAFKQPGKFESGRLQPAGLRGVWAYQTADESIVALFRQDRLLKDLDSVITSVRPVRDISLSVLPPGTDSRAFFLSEEIGDPFPSWKVALRLKGPDPFQSESRQKITSYVWTGILMTAGIAMLSILMASYLRRQVLLTKLKNDLIANVSHELKTPLASMRLLVDTLRDGHYEDTALVQEYLQLISKENARLSSLIEGFLTFSRMERNKTKFDSSLVQMGDIVHPALESLDNRLHAPGCRFELDLAPEMPPVVGDRDALITVLVNLLDNALKYTGDAKEIRLRGFYSNGNIFLEVEDNGIGFPRSAARKIFDRFYQVDRTLSRRTGGCGLGLSIVQFIVSAHHGSVTAKSQPGKGSTFTVQLPAAGVDAHAK